MIPSISIESLRKDNGLKRLSMDEGQAILKVLSVQSFAVHINDKENGIL